MERDPGKSTPPVVPGAQKPTPVPAEPPAEHPLAQVAVITHNVRSTITGTARAAVYATDAAQCDVLLTQEDHATPDSGALMPPGWDTFQGRTRRCSVHWRTGVFKKRTARTLLLNLANGLTFPGARREGAVVLLEHLATGKLLKATSGHGVPHADEDDRPGVLTTNPRGPKAVVPMLGSLVADSAANPADAEVIGIDINIDLDEDLRIHDQGAVERLRAAGFVTDVEQLGPVPDSHGTQEYDWLLAKGGRWVEHSTLPKGPSDHRARRAVVEF